MNKKEIKQLMEFYSQPFSIRIKPEIRMKINEIAKIENRKVNNLIETILIEYLEENK